MKYPTIEINHECFAVNLMDADFAVRLTEAGSALRSELSEAETDHAGSDENILAAKVTATHAFFDAVLGPGASKRIFKYYNEAVEYTDNPRLPSRKIGGLV